MKLVDLNGKLIVIEGTDGAGRTTQIDLLKPWLEELGHAVLDTGMSRSTLAGEGIRRAKEGNNLGRVTQSLFYATDFVDRLENEIVPALRAGFVVLTDRYIYSLMARAMVRGVDAQWIRSIYSVALKPDAVFYLRLGIDATDAARYLYARVRLLGIGNGSVSRAGHVREFLQLSGGAAGGIRSAERRIQIRDNRRFGGRPERVFATESENPGAARKRFAETIRFDAGNANKWRSYAESGGRCNCGGSPQAFSNTGSRARFAAVYSAHIEWERKRPFRDSEFEAVSLGKFKQFSANSPSCAGDRYLPPSGRRCQSGNTCWESTHS